MEAEKRGFSHSRYEALIEATFEVVRGLGKNKGGEYSGDDDRLLNFRRNGRDQGLPMETIWRVYAAKHWDAIGQYIMDRRTGTKRLRTESIAGRADDLIVYLLLFKAMLVEHDQDAYDNAKLGGSAKDDGADALAYGLLLRPVAGEDKAVLRTGPERLVPREGSGSAEEPVETPSMKARREIIYSLIDAMPISQTNRTNLKNTIRRIEVSAPAEMRGAIIRDAAKDALRPSAASTSPFPPAPADEPSTQ